MIWSVLSGLMEIARDIRDKFAAGWGTEVVGTTPGDVTRTIDAYVERRILEVVEGLTDSFVFIGEESGRLVRGRGEHLFVVDPLDGSTNYVAGIPIFTISVGIGRPVTGTLGDVEGGVLLDVPSLRYYLVEGGRLHTNDGAPRTHANVVYAQIDGDPNIAVRVAELCRRLGCKVRSLGSASYEMLLAALGRGIGFIDVRGRLRPVDIAAAQLVAVAVGARAVDGRCAPLREVPLDRDARTSAIVGGEQFVGTVCGPT